MQSAGYERFNKVNIKGETHVARDMVNLDIVLSFLNLQTYQQADLADAVSQKTTKDNQKLST